MNIRATAVAVALAALTMGTLAVSWTDAGAVSARLTLDGRPFKPELALTPASRSQGLMNRIPAPKDGMLFVSQRPTKGGFWMMNVHIPLTISFFDATGKRVRRLSMQPCHIEPCKVYYPKRVYRFALEMRAFDSRPAKQLGPVSELRRLVRLAS